VRRKLGRVLTVVASVILAVPITAWYAGRIMPVAHVQAEGSDLGNREHVRLLPANAIAGGTGFGGPGNFHFGPPNKSHGFASPGGLGLEITPSGVHTRNGVTTRTGKVVGPPSLGGPGQDKGGGTWQGGKTDNGRKSGGPGGTGPRDVQGR